MRRLKLLGALGMAFFLTGMARADDGGRVNGRFIGGIGLGVAPTVNGFASAYRGGAGIDGTLGFVIDQNFSLLLAIDSFIFNTNDRNTYLGEVNFIPSVKYEVGDSEVRPYFLAGVGANDSMSYFETSQGEASVTQRFFAVEPGAGVDVFLNDALDLYLQAKFVLVFSASDLSYIPISIGLNFK